ncbi:MAG: methyltransferase domain-containing protein [Syntrophorhabdaceae bacterium]
MGNMKTIEDGQLVLIIWRGRRYLKRIALDQSFHGKGGMLRYSELVGKPYGIRINEYDIFEPTIEDIVMYGLKRETQIVFPKESFYIAFRLSLKKGSRVLEVGTGSGANTFILSHAVGPEGRVVSYEQEERHFRNAKRNIERFCEWDNVELHNEEFTGYNGEEFDAAFIDVREPWAILDKVRDAVKRSAPIGMILPTANQVSDVLKTLEENGYGDTEVLEILMRKYKTVSERVRPTDRMIAHTGYLVFTRKLDITSPSSGA